MSLFWMIGGLTLFFYSFASKKLASIHGEPGFHFQVQIRLLKYKKLGIINDS